MRIRHIINYFKTQSGTDIHIAMPIAISSLLTAKSYHKKHKIEHLVACYSDDLEHVDTSAFIKTRPLDRTACGVFKTRTVSGKKLPIFRDILDRLAYDSDDEDILIFTNADIIVQPFFYSLIAEKCKSYDCFSITRRCIPANYTSVDDLPQIYSEVGKKHPGHDCFVFNKKVYDEIDPGETCIGAGHMELPFLIGLASHAKNFEIFDNLHATIHIGDERSWASYGDMNEHNLRETNRVYGLYKDKLKIPHLNAMIRHRLAELRIPVEDKRVVYQPKSKLEGHTIVLPYFSEQELGRFHDLADYINNCTFKITNCRYNFLIVACSLPLDNSLVDKFRYIAPSVGYVTPVGKLDYGNGSCSLFWDVAEHVHNNYPHDGFMLWMESDMVPLKPDWIDSLDAIWENQSILGMRVKRCFYASTQTLTTEHINGGACYNKMLAGLVPREARKHPFDMSLYPFVSNDAKFTDAFRFISNNRIRDVVFDPSAVVGHAYVAKHNKDQVIRDTINLCSDVFNVCVLPVNSEHCCDNARDFPSGLVECPVHGHFMPGVSASIYDYKRRRTK